MKKLFFILMFVFAGTLTAAAQDWSEYSRGSDAWHRLNRSAMFRPWKYDRAGRLKRGNARNYYVRKRRPRRR